MRRLCVAVLKMQNVFILCMLVEIYFARGVRALSEVRRHYPIRLTLIGNPDDTDYMNHEVVDDAVACYRLIADNSDWIDFHKSLPNARVLELMRTADVGLLPTRGDTYGYSVLEMQAAGMPCITTNLRALPEINNASCGWLIEVPKNENEDALWTSADDRERYVLLVYDGLVRICTQVAEHPECLREKALASLKRIREEHSPERYAEQLMAVYQEAVGDS